MNNSNEIKEISPDNSDSQINSVGYSNKYSNFENKPKASENSISSASKREESKNGHGNSIINIIDDASSSPSKV